VRSEFDAIATNLGSGLAGTAAVGWGDARATWRIDLADGRSVAARRIGGPDRAERAARFTAVVERVSSFGLPVPPVTPVGTPDAVWLVSDWVDGDTGAAWLGDDDRARTLAGAMGSLSRRLRAVDTTGLHLRVETAANAAARAAAQLSAVRPDLAAPTVHAIKAAIDRIGPGQDDGPSVLAHGDFAPINVVMRDDGTIAALLDFEHAGLGSALSDVAWWGWVVRHHHPSAWESAWSTFVAAADVDLDATAQRASALVVTRLLEAVAGAHDPLERERWRSRLDQAAGW
jgi:aminoglycoside phosphotransferase (APT) family kinase protein